MADENASAGTLGGINAEEVAVRRDADKAARAAAKAPAPLVSTDEPEGDGLVEIALVSPWRVSAFGTPLLPGVVLTQEGIRLSPEDAKIMYEEAKRSGFTTVSSVPLEDVTNSEDVPA